MGIKFSNNAEGVLTAGISDAATTDLALTAGDGLLFPTIVLASGDYFYATLVTTTGTREIIKVTEHQGGTDVFQTYVRAQDGTAASAFSVGDKCQMRPSKVHFETFRDDIATNLAHNIASEQLLYAPSGLTMWIYNPAGEIPDGWSAKAGPADCLLAVAGGSEDYNVAGENVVGSWTPTSHAHTLSAHTHTGPSHTHTGPSHTHTLAHAHTITHGHTTQDFTLTTAEIPAHTHTFSRASNVGTFTNYPMPGYAPSGIFTSSSVGGGDPHNHGVTSGSTAANTGVPSVADTGADGTGATGADGTGVTAGPSTPNTSSVGAPASDRPYAAVGLLIERD